MFKLKIKHLELVKQGQYEAAKKLLSFMTRKSILLGLSDVDWTVSMILDNLGYKYSISCRGNYATYYINSRRVSK